MNAHARSTLTAAVALTVLASLSLTLPSAWSTSATATTEGSSGDRPASARAAAVHVHVTVMKHRIIRSKNGFRPGNTVFDLTLKGGGTAAIELLRLRSGYTFAEFRHDLDSDDIEAVRRIDRQAVFYGGMPVYERGPSQFGARLDAGHYFLLDSDHPRWVRLRVEGAPEHRLLP